jgi:hypothetical protein
MVIARQPPGIAPMWVLRRWIFPLIGGCDRGAAERLLSDEGEQKVTDFHRYPGARARP